MVPNKIINFKFWRNESLMEKDIKIINFNKFIKLNRKFCKQYWPKTFFIYHFLKIVLNNLQPKLKILKR